MQPTIRMILSDVAAFGERNELRSDGWWPSSLRVPRTGSTEKLISVLEQGRLPSLAASVSQALHHEDRGKRGKKFPSAAEKVEHQQRVEDYRLLYKIWNANADRLASGVPVGEGNALNKNSTIAIGLMSLFEALAEKQPIPAYYLAVELSEIANIREGALLIQNCAWRIARKICSDPHTIYEMSDWADRFSADGVQDVAEIRRFADTVRKAIPMRRRQWAGQQMKSGVTIETLATVLKDLKAYSAAWGSGGDLSAGILALMGFGKPTKGKSSTQETEADRTAIFARAADDLFFAYAPLLASVGLELSLGTLRDQSALAGAKPHRDFAVRILDGARFSKFVAGISPSQIDTGDGREALTRLVDVAHDQILELAAAGYPEASETLVNAAAFLARRVRQMSGKLGKSEDLEFSVDYYDEKNILERIALKEFEPTDPWSPARWHLDASPTRYAELWEEAVDTVRAVANGSSARSIALTLARDLFTTIESLEDILSPESLKDNEALRWLMPYSEDFLAVLARVKVEFSVILDDAS